MQLELVSNGLGTILTDTNNTGGLATPGFVSIGVFNMNLTSGTSSPPIPPPPGTYAQLDVTSMNIASGSAGTITIILENSSYTAPTIGLGATGSIGGTITNGTVTATSYVDATNAVPFLSLQGPNSMPGSANQDLSMTSNSSSFSATGVDIHQHRHVLDVSRARRHIR